MLYIFLYTNPLNNIQEIEYFIPQCDYKYVIDKFTTTSTVQKQQYLQQHNNNHEFHVQH